MSALQKVFNYQENPVRTIAKDGEPWFVTRDVCDILDIDNVGQALSRLDEDEKNTITLNDGTPGNPNMSIVNEPGLYSLILTSRKPEAKAFKRWITHEVIPAIRKTGSYSLQKDSYLIADPIERAKAWILEAEKSQALTLQLEGQRPKVIFAEALEVSNNTILIGELAKILRQNGINIGQNRLFERLRTDGYLIKRGESYNQPTQYSMELNLMEIKKRTINNPDGSVRATTTTKVTGKGQIYFVNKFKSENLQMEGVI